MKNKKTPFKSKFQLLYDIVFPRRLNCLRKGVTINRVLLLIFFSMTYDFAYRTSLTETEATDLPRREPFYDQQITVT